MKKFFTLILVALLPMVASADVIEVDGIYYDVIVKAGIAEVTSNPTKYTGAVNIPASFTYDGKEFSVTSIRGSAFYSCNYLTSVTIPGSVTSIGYDAFYNCSGLKKVIVPDIAAWCEVLFEGGGDLNSNPLSIAKHLYSDEETEITNLIIPNSVSCIGSYAFRYCSSLTSVTIPNSVISIGDNAFDRCSGLTSITIPQSVTSIGENSFWGCSGLISVTIPNSVTRIGLNAFQRCSGLKKVIVPDIDAWYGISFVNADANPLYYAHHLYSDEETEITNLIIPNGVKSLKYTFCGCTGLTSITIPNSVTSIGSAAFSRCSSLTSITIPNSVTMIEGSAFSGCSGLTSITIPNSVTSIGGYTFSGCSGLTSVIIGSGVKKISSQAFANCAELTDVYCYAENVPNTTSDAFNGSYIEYATLHVPAESMELYKAKEPWSQFGTIKTLDGDTPEPPKPEKCATPAISFTGGKLMFTSATEGAECVTVISDSDIKTHYGNEISLTATYNITVYATRADYVNSDTIHATLCWIDVEPATEGIINEDAVTEVKAMPVLIQTQGGTVTIQGTAEGTPIAIYDVSGKQYGSALSEKNRTTISTSLQPGTIAIVKIGEKAVKVLVK